MKNTGNRKRVKKRREKVLRRIKARSFAAKTRKPQDNQWKTDTVRKGGHSFHTRAFLKKIANNGKYAYHTTSQPVEHLQPDLNLSRLLFNLSRHKG